MATEPWVKRPTEVRVYSVNFGNQPEIADLGQSLTGTPTVSVSPSGPTVPSSGTGSPAISGTKVTFQVSGGTDATDYVITVTATTDGTPAATLVEGNTLQVRAVGTEGG